MCRGLSKRIWPCSTFLRDLPDPKSKNAWAISVTGTVMGSLEAQQRGSKWDSSGAGAVVSGSGSGSGVCFWVQAKVVIWTEVGVDRQEAYQRLLSGDAGEPVSGLSATTELLRTPSIPTPSLVAHQSIWFPATSRGLTMFLIWWPVHRLRYEDSS